MLGLASYIYRHLYSTLFQFYVINQLTFIRLFCQYKSLIQFAVNSPIHPISFKFLKLIPDFTLKKKLRFCGN